MTLSERIYRVLAKSNDPDPHSVARKLMARMSQEERDEALASCLADRVRIEITRARLGHHQGDDQGLPAGSRTEGPSKWAAMVQPRVYVPTVGWKFEIALTAEDLHRVADEYASRTASMIVKEREYRDRAVKLAVSGLATWGEYVAQQEQAA